MALSSGTLYDLPMLRQLALALAFLLTACTSGNEGGPPTSAPNETLAPVIAAREALAALSGRTPEEVEVVAVTPMQWPDACLGLPRPDEVCAQVITPGYEVALRLNGNVAIYRTDEGTNVRLAEDDVTSD